MGNFCQWIVYLLLNNFSILQMGGGVFINRKSHKTYENLYSHSHFPDWSLCRSILVPGPYIWHPWFKLSWHRSIIVLNSPLPRLYPTSHLFACTQRLEHFVSLVKSKLFRWILSLTFNTSQVELSQQQCYGPPGTFNLLLICVIVPVYSVVYVCMLFTGKYRLKGKTLAWLNCTSKLEINI